MRATSCLLRFDTDAHALMSRRTLNLDPIRATATAALNLRRAMNRPSWSVGSGSVDCCRTKNGWLRTPSTVMRAAGSMVKHLRMRSCHNSAAAQHRHSSKG